VSEKRTKKILQSEGLTIAPVGPGGRPEGEPTEADGEGDGDGDDDAGEGGGGQTIYPTSKLIQNLDISQWTNKVKVRYFSKKRGKGLVATEDIKEGDTIWKEDPFVVAAEWQVSFISFILFYSNNCKIFDLLYIVGYHTSTCKDIAMPEK
jgi:hypothetical protein